jgi:hypothetical protein
MHRTMCLNRRLNIHCTNYHAVSYVLEPCAAPLRRLNAFTLKTWPDQTVFGPSNSR